LTRERRLIDGLVEAAERRLLSSAHDISEGGLAVALAEACFNPEGQLGASQIGASIDALDSAPAELFGEGPSTVILSAPPENVEAVREIFKSLEIKVIGRVIARPRLMIRLNGEAVGIDQDAAELRRLFEDALPGRLGTR